MGPVRGSLYGRCVAGVWFILTPEDGVRKERTWAKYNGIPCIRIGDHNKREFHKRVSAHDLCSIVRILTFQRRPSRLLISALWISGLTADILRRSICDQTRNAFIGLATWRVVDVDELSWASSAEPAARRLTLPASLLRRQPLVASEYGVVEPGRTINDPNSVDDIVIDTDLLALWADPVVWNKPKYCY